MRVLRDISNFNLRCLSNRIGRVFKKRNQRVIERIARVSPRHDIGICHANIVINLDTFKNIVVNGKMRTKAKNG